MNINEFHLSTAIFDKRPTVQCWSAPWKLVLNFSSWVLNHLIHFVDPSEDIYKKSFHVVAFKRLKRGCFSSTCITSCRLAVVGKHSVCTLHKKNHQQQNIEKDRHESFQDINDCSTKVRPSLGPKSQNLGPISQNLRFSLGPKSHLILLSPLLDVYSKAAWKLT